MVADADELGIAVSTLDCGTRIIDCGVKAAGSIEAGRRLAEVCLAGSGDVYMSPAESEAWHGPQAVTRRDEVDPVAACMASQYAGWEIKGEKFFAMGSGPMRAAACREELFEDIGHCERPDVCVGVLETSKLPPDGVCIDIAEKCGIAPDRLTLLVARTSSLAGTVQIVARSVETALHKLHVLGLRPVACSQRRWEWRRCRRLPTMIWQRSAGRTTRFLYGGDVTLSVHGDDDSLDEIGPRVPSNCVARLRPAVRRDFRALRPRFLSHRSDAVQPGASSHFVNVDTGQRHAVRPACARRARRVVSQKNSPAILAGLCEH